MSYEFASVNQIGGLAQPRGLVPPFFVDFLKKIGG